MLTTEELNTLDEALALSFEARQALIEDDDSVIEAIEGAEAVITKLYDFVEDRDARLPPEVLERLLDFVENHAADLAQANRLTLDEAEELAMACGFLAEIFGD